MAERTEIYHMEQKYRVVFEQAASTKGVIGFKCEVNGDDLNEVKIEAEGMLEWAQLRAPIEQDAK